VRPWDRSQTPQHPRHGHRPRHGAAHREGARWSRPSRKPPRLRQHVFSRASMSRILIVEDEPDIALALEDDLRTEGYDVEVAADGDTASRRAREDTWDLLLLDVMLPRKDGFEVCRDLRRTGVLTPIIFLTARAQEAEKVLGLEMGGDDYVTKPFSPRELRALIKTVLRRVRSDATDRYAFGD